MHAVAFADLVAVVAILLVVVVGCATTAFVTVVVGWEVVVAK